jgi:hypothetical protein
MGRLISGRNATVYGGTVVVACVAGAFSIHGVFASRVNSALALRLMGEGRSKLPSLHDAMRNYSMVSSIFAHHGVDAPL